MYGLLSSSRVDFYMRHFMRLYLNCRAHVYIGRTVMIFPDKCETVIVLLPNKYFPRTRLFGQLRQDQKDDPGHH